MYMHTCNEKKSKNKRKKQKQIKNLMKILNKYKTKVERTFHWTAEPP